MSGGDGSDIASVSADPYAPGDGRLGTRFLRRNATVSFNIIVHAVAGTLAVGAGVIALVVTKGSRLHRWAGRLFAVAMVVTAGTGAIDAWFIPQAINVIAGLFTIYLVATSYAAVVRSPPRADGFEVAAAIFALGIVIVSIRFGIEAQANPSVGKDGFGAEPYFFFAVVAFVALIGDIVAIWRRGGEGPHRIARHLWRMGFSLHIAAGSLLDGPGTRAFPEVLQGTLWLTGPVHLIAIAVLGWLIYVFAGQRFRNEPTAADREDRTLAR